jgi:hypothetical protein
MRLASLLTARSSISLSSIGVLVVQLPASSMVRGLDDGYSWLQHAACRAAPRDALHARQQMQGPCYSGALEEIEEIGRRWRRRCVLRRTRRSVAIRTSVSYWYQSYRRSLETWQIDSPALSLECLCKQAHVDAELYSADSILVETANCTVQFARSRLLLLSAAGMGYGWRQPCLNQ